MPQEVKWGISMVVAVGLVWIGWKVHPVLLALHIVVCFVLCIVILLQSGNAADLAGAFGGAGSQTAFGPRGAATLLSKATTWCAIVFMMTSLALSQIRSAAGTGSSVLETMPTSQPAPAKPQLPASPPIVPPASQPPASQPPAQQQAPQPQPPAQSKPQPPH